MKRWILFPFLLAAFPILALYANNTESVSIDETVVPILLALLGTGATWAILFLVVKDAHRAAVATAALVLLFFSYGYAKDGLTRALPIDYPERFVRHRYMILAWATLAGLALGWAWRSRRDAWLATPVLNIVAAFLVILQVATVGFHAAALRADDNRFAVEGVTRTVGAGEEIGLPNIYYIVLDGYAHGSTLETKFGWDNSPFESNLTGLGFSVVPQSRANYPTTTMSLASTLNMKYLDEMIAQRDSSSTDYYLPFKLINENRAVDLARANDYRYVHFDSGWGPTEEDVRAWKTVNCEGRTPFQLVLIRETAANIIANALHTIEQDKRTRVECQLDALANAPNLRAAGDPPMFVFAHLMIPHGPFVFGANGELVADEGTPTGDVEPTTGDVTQQRARYLAQLRYTNDRIEKVTRSIIANETIPPVIVIMSDHGSAFTWETTDDFIQERLRNFEAIRLPGHEDEIYANMTPVNVMRTVFRVVLSADLPPLDDRSYFQPEGTRRFYSLRDVTDVAAFSGAAS